jgi:hypothetical protein
MIATELMELEPVFNPAYPISRGERARIKHAISNDPGWPRYRQTALAGFNMNDLNKRDLYATCDDLGIDIWRLIFDAPMTKTDFPDDNPVERKVPTRRSKRPQRKLAKAIVAAPITQPISIGGLAERLGVPRQRIYNMVGHGRIKTELRAGTQVINPKEANRVLDAAVTIDTPTGSRLVFDFI